MKIAYNSAYNQIETFILPSPSKPVLYVYLCSNFQQIATPNAKF